MRLLVIADVGGETVRHIGDEAMLEANLEGFRRAIPDVAFTVVSRDPEWTAARYGVDAIAPFGFRRDGARRERQAMLEAIVSQSREDAWDAVVVSGGGNLSSTWPDLLYERAALLLLAKKFGKPSIVIGQTLGPKLARDERRLLAEALSSASFVGVREHPSFELARRLGVERLHYQTDDALFLGTSSSGSSEFLGVPRREEPRQAPIAVTIDPQIRAAGAAVYGALVRQLRELAEATGAAITLIPHAWGDERGPSDLTEARLLAEQLRAHVATNLGAREAARITGEASLVISSRYHPIVFGLAAGVPSLGIHGDEYCRIKLEGALAHASLEQWTATYREVRRGKLLPKALALWSARDAVRRALEAKREQWREEERRRWSAIVRAAGLRGLRIED